MKKLFNEEGLYELEASNLAEETARVLQPIFEKFYKKGYLVRDIAHVIIGTVQVQESGILLRNLKIKGDSK